METLLRPMPGSFGDDNLTELAHSSFEGPDFPAAEDESQSMDHVTSWSTENMFDIDLGDIDWHKYEPPNALRKAPNVNSLILLDIVAQSIDNVRERISEEDRLKRAEEEKRQAAEEEARRNGKSSGPYLPIIIPPEKPIEPDISPMNNMYGGRTGDPDAVNSSTTGKAPVVSVMKDSIRRRFAIRRFFHRAPESGESSTAGSMREEFQKLEVRDSLRRKLQARLSMVDISNTDSKTQEKLLELRKSGFITDAEPIMVDPEVECVSCLDDIPMKDAVRVSCHSYCRECFVRLVTAAVQNEQQWPPKCCLNQIPFRLIERNIPHALKKTFQDRASEWELPAGERVYCHHPECAVWIRPKNIKPNKRQALCERGHVTCTICRGPSHGNQDCPQDFDITLTNILAEQEGWKRCFNCHALVEHSAACQHMTCRCGTEFCYVCGLRWKTCQCTMQQLSTLKQAAENRREKRRLKEQEDAEELRVILAQIEELEREEARRAELDRLEQARLEEERWQRQIKERIRFENLRRKEVITKFQELRILLKELHELQDVMVNVQQEENATSLIQEADAMKLSLAERLEMERHELQQKISEKIAVKENGFKQEYSIRASSERKVEQEYLQQLQDFWTGNPEAEHEIDRAMFPLRSRMDQGHRSWQKWKDHQMYLYKAKMDDELTMREELMYSQKERMKSLYEGKELELTRRLVAEKKWFQEVILERERLLESYAVQEMEGDADSLFGREDAAP
ncbi:hypothetical protein QQS21_009983 [Conoideocrella luteorostrata]|uniref:RBR-type E3 ubiquitin transferase n=1 Tax=Conoideocrella luteorostrata TaxID=1105319 RepID=A0AAJ0CFX3_9HYPO|nr:hypothetical protein QQS21_009983 [Conoideocrella luteorostrata]